MTPTTKATKANLWPMSTTRMFVAIRPPEAIREELADFLAPREGMTWIDPQQWHLTLAFLAAVPEHRAAELAAALGRTALRHNAFQLRLSGAGAFPDPLAAKVLWLRPNVELTPLATGVRHAANSVGATPDGQRFVGHLSVAWPRRPIDARRWLQVLDTFSSDSWRVTEVELVASYLGEGPHRRPRHEVVAALPLTQEQTE
ncbi:RNA 2',3'-cyclic phosphodiesterase [Flexivirga endophytica]|uniref:RNA 2',3'-cyclic phosphodiesterase n=2 Tax=Flexivirga endophytica TaxID=1849103 RepID=A0A916T920_9MICO|nr:RNA 2',3'-cyclic phosphodiesterase [Flexivirga endophytica]GHB43998.1 RNA 2',3'-cyclic phosphodiesterase [Flexivirga endophytica]